MPSGDDLTASIEEAARLSRSGDIYGALTAADRAVSAARSRPEPNDSGYGVALRLAAETHRAVGDPQTAERLATQSVQVLEQSGARRDEDYALALHELAAAKHELAKMDEADRHYVRALGVAREVAGAVNLIAAMCLTGLGELRRETGSYIESIELHNFAWLMRRDLLGDEHAAVAESLDHLATLKHRAEMYAEAETDLKEGLRIRRVTLGDRHPAVIASSLHIANLFRDTGRQAHAAPMYEAVVALSRDIFGRRHPAVAEALQQFALLHCLTGSPRAAQPLCEEARQILLETFGERHPRTAESMVNLGRVHAALGRPKEALPLFVRAAAAEDDQLDRVFDLGSETQRLAYGDQLQEVMSIVASLVMRHLHHDGEAVREAFDLLLRRKALVIDAAAAHRAAYGHYYPDLMVRMFRDLVTQAKLTGMAGGTDESRARLAEFEAIREGVERQFQTAFPGPKLGAILGRADRRAVAEALPPGSALAEFFQYVDYDFDAVGSRGEPIWRAPRYAAFVLRAKDPDGVSLVDIGDAEGVDRLVAGYRERVTLEAEDRHPPSEAEPAVVDPGESLRRTVFDALVDHMAGANRLFLSPEGDLTRLPFEVLPVNGGFLLDRFTISYVSTAREVVRFKEPVTVEATAPVVAADPDFDLARSSPPAGSPPPGAGEQSEDSAGPRRELDRAGLSFARLGGTRLEGMAVARQLGVEPLLEGDVLEAAIKDCRAPRILHLATHGFFLPDQRSRANGDADAEAVGTRRLRGPGLENPLLRSGLALAGANTWLAGGKPPEAAQDGIMTAEDVAGLKLLGTELVVLSACETGLGQTRRGEGVFGLRRAFVLAGARSLVMSLWKVPDDATRDLMEEFYRRLLEGAPRAEALREAQLAVRDDRTRYPERYRGPWYWGAFILQGDPGVMSRSPTAPHAAPFAEATEEPLGEEGSPSGRARAVLEPLLEDPLPRRETPAPSNAPIREVLEHEGFRCSDAEGSLNVEMEGPGTGPVVVRARMRLGGVASFFVPLPHVRGMGARKKLLGDLLLVCNSAYYLKALLFGSGQPAVASEVPLACLTPETLHGLVAGLAPWALMGDRDVPAGLGEAVVRSNLQTFASLRVEVEETKRSLPSMLLSAGHIYQPSADGTLGFLLSPGPGTVRLRVSEMLISMEVRIPRAAGDRKKNLARLLELNGRVGVAAVALDSEGLLARYHVPCLSLPVLTHAHAAMSAVVNGAMELRE